MCASRLFSDFLPAGSGPEASLRSVSPERFEVEKLARLLVENVHDGVAVVDQNPVAWIYSVGGQVVRDRIECAGITAGTQESCLRIESLSTGQKASWSRASRTA